MCGGLKYVGLDPVSGVSIKKQVFFPIPHARYPSLKTAQPSYTNGASAERKHSDISAPTTGWARYTSLESDYWQRYRPRMRLIPALEFPEKGTCQSLAGSTYWTGLKVERPEKSFAYVVTNPAKRVVGDSSKDAAACGPGHDASRNGC